MAWSRLIKFVDRQGNVRYGEPKISAAKELVEKFDNGSLEAEVLEGSTITKLQISGRTAAVATLLGPLTAADVPIVKCVGLNYTKHIREAGRTPPPYPSIFIKGSPTIASWNEDIPIHEIAQQDQLDYEGEMFDHQCIVIGKPGKDIPHERVLEHIAGYTVGNDLSTRTWQRDPKFAGGVPQWCFSKGFDKFAPVGPMLVSPSVAGLADNLQLQTFVNDELRQDTNTSDLLFGVTDIVSFLSQGQTLEEGTVIMTGTPSGVAMGMSPPKWLKDGDVVKVTIEHLGSIENKMVFETDSMIWKKQGAK